MTPIATIVVLALTAAVTLIAFQRPDIKNRLMFDPYAILRHKEWERLFTSGLIHADWTHFFMNAYSFYSFGEMIEYLYGPWTLLFIYVSALLGGSLLSLVIHRHHAYRSLGASGGVCGVIFASMFLLPGGGVQMFPFPFSVPAYLYAPAFLIGSFVASRRGRDNIGHDAHLGGAIIGLLVATAMYPRMVEAQPWMFAIAVGLSLVILLALIFDPFHNWDKMVKREQEFTGSDRDRRYASNRARNQKMAEVDRLLDKVAKGGVQSLSASEREKLERLSRDLGGRD